MQINSNALALQGADSLVKRVRIPVKSIYRDQEMAEKLHTFTLTIPGVVSAQANSITGRILILFREGKTCAGMIENRIAEYLEKSLSSRYRKATAIFGPDFMQETAQALMPEMPPGKSIEPAGSPFHALNRHQLEQQLGSCCTTGLSRETSRERLEQAGFNVLSEKKRKSVLAALFEGLNDSSTKLLLGVGVASFFLGHIPDAIAVFGIVLLETALGTIQQMKAEKSIYSLKKMMVSKARVLRDGKEVEVDAKKLVPGDVIIVESGDKVPADARIIDCAALQVSEASLTGEAAPVDKSDQVCDLQTELADRSNMLYMGSNVFGGRARAMVVATGMNTEIGRIASLLQTIRIEPTPLQRKITGFTHSLTKICLVSWGIIGGAALLAGAGLGKVLTVGVGFAIGAVPESLPAVVTVAMAASVQRIAKKNAIVRKLPAVETLGSANVICCDKTGTLTMNEMTVREIYTDRRRYFVTGQGYEPEGRILAEDGKHINSEALTQLLHDSILCNNACLVKTGNKWMVQGDPTEGALLTVAGKAGWNIDKIRSTHLRVQEIPFDSRHRSMTVVVQEPEGRRSLCKGALEDIIDRCTMLYENGEERLLTGTDREQLADICGSMAEQGLRILAFAYKKLNQKTKETERNYVFLGMVGMEDPPRPGVGPSIAKCHQAGIKVVMITGDHLSTAKAIGRKLGILTDGIAVSGNELENMSREELDEKISHIQVFARTSPEQKLRIVQAFKRAGHVVAMTGDGVNDAPAIKEADIGIAMGAGGSELAGDVASIMLLDDDFSTIVAAIEEGRTVTRNIQSSTKYLLTGALGEMAAIGLAAAFTGTLPLLSIQILWVNVICESLLGAPLALQLPSKDSMTGGPAAKDGPLIDRQMAEEIVLRGMMTGLSTFAIYGGSLLLGLGIQKARTMAFTGLILNQIAQARKQMIDRQGTSNQGMNFMSASSMALLLGILYHPFGQAFFGTLPLNPADWAALGGVTMLTNGLQSKVGLH